MNLRRFNKSQLIALRDKSHYVISRPSGILFKIRDEKGEENRKNKRKGKKRRKKRKHYKRETNWYEMQKIQLEAKHLHSFFREAF